MTNGSDKKALDAKAKEGKWDRRLLDDRSPNLEVLRIEDIGNDPRYQRDLSEQRVSEMVQKYNPGELTLATVSRRADGTMWMLDGRHRSAMLLRLGKQVIWADVMDGLTFEQEAWLFFRLNDNHRNMSPWFKFNARLQAKEAVAVRIQAIIEKAGFHLSKHGDRRHSIQAVSTVQNLYDMGRLAKSLEIIGTAWPNDAGATESAVLQGLGLFLLTYDDHEDYDAGQFLVAIEKVGPSGISRRAREIELETGRSYQGGGTMAIAFRDAYNGKLVRGSKPKRQLTGIPLMWRRTASTPQQPG